MLVQLQHLLVRCLITACKYPLQVALTNVFFDISTPSSQGYAATQSSADDCLQPCGYGSGA
jgi:hypothetical protein